MSDAAPDTMGSESGEDAPPGSTSSFDQEPGLQEKLENLADAVTLLLDDRAERQRAAQPPPVAEVVHSPTVQAIARHFGLPLRHDPAATSRDVDATLIIIQLRAGFDLLNVKLPDPTSPLHAMGLMLESLIKDVVRTHGGQFREMMGMLMVQYFIYIARVGSKAGGEYAELMLRSAAVPTDATDVPALTVQIQDRQRDKRTSGGTSTRRKSKPKKDPRKTATPQKNDEEVKRLRAQLAKLGNGTRGDKVKKGAGSDDDP